MPGNIVPLKRTIVSGCYDENKSDEIKRRLRYRELEEGLKACRCGATTYSGTVPVIFQDMSTQHSERCAQCPSANLLQEKA
jgi:hypothetical protein